MSVFSLWKGEEICCMKMSLYPINRKRLYRVHIEFSKKKTSNFLFFTNFYGHFNKDRPFLEHPVEVLIIMINNCKSISEYLESFRKHSVGTFICTASMVYLLKPEVSVPIINCFKG